LSCRAQGAPITTSILVRTAGLLVLSNIFRTFAWSAHLRNLAHRPWYIAAVVSWGIALFAVCFVFRSPPSA
jgi:uncharacterized protein (DUF486 family)